MLTIQNTSTSTVLRHIVSSLSHDVEVATLQGLLAELAQYDGETNMHAHRMVRWTLAVARHLGLPGSEVYHLCLAALLHDIGKLEIPVLLLRKKGPLTIEEWHLMRLHPEFGARILQAAGGIFATLVPLVLAHHERWDGSGYPLGLAKENIPLGARVLAVIDSFDAMTATRPYHRGISFNDACATLEEGVGILYDPRIVACFLSVLNSYPTTLPFRTTPLLAA